MKFTCKKQLGFHSTYVLLIVNQFRFEVNHLPKYLYGELSGAKRNIDPSWFGEEQQIIETGAGSSTSSPETGIKNIKQEPKAHDQPDEISPR